MKIFLLNGPPRSGKDTATKFMSQEYGGVEVKFATPLKKAAAAIYLNGDDERFATEFDTAEMKDIPSDQFFGKTPREVQIAISEQFLKLFHDTKVFGQILGNHIEHLKEKGHELFFVSDSGFRDEAQVLADRFGKNSVVLIKIHREGFDYKGDSRSYINLDDIGVKTFNITNPNEEVEKFHAALSEIVAYETGIMK